jgi:hypothetical protein
MDKYEEVHEQINCLQALLRRFDELKLTTMEFAYLKLIAFTSTGKRSAGEHNASIPSPLSAVRHSVDVVCIATAIAAHPELPRAVRPHRIRERGRYGRRSGPLQPAPVGLAVPSRLQPPSAGRAVLLGPDRKCPHRKRHSFHTQDGRPPGFRPGGCVWFCGRSVAGEFGQSCRLADSAHHSLTHAPISTNCRVLSTNVFLFCRRPTNGSHCSDRDTLAASYSFFETYLQHSLKSRHAALRISLFSCFYSSHSSSASNSCTAIPPALAGVSTWEGVQGIQNVPHSAWVKTDVVECTGFSVNKAPAFYSENMKI